jgi:murein DD-endopeptidase MepM/ murein hydrolase activator NlpD
MTHSISPLRAGIALSALLVLSACDDFDYDLRGNTGGFTTAPAALQATAVRPEPDNRGVISYPNYQVALARRGDTVQSVASRVGVSPRELASFNALPLDAPLRQDEVIALPKRVAEPSPATGATTTGPIRPAPVDVTTLAGQAIDKSADTPTSTPKPQTGQEPIRHQVARGETAYTIARLYNVPVRALARWNGLGPQFTVREGQFLMIPVAQEAPPRSASASTTAPGQGSPTPTPPSAEKPLPKESEITKAEAEKPAPKPDIGKQTKPASSGRFAVPVKGTVIREYSKGRNDGINIKAAPGAAVKAADAGTVAAITESAEGVPIIVVRHAGNLLTVYANVTDVAVKKGDKVRRGQTIAKLRDGDQSFVHFEVRDGFESVDPNDYLG